MLQSKLFTKTKKDAPKDEVSVNAQLLIRAGYIDKLMAGVYTLLPLGYRTLKNLEKIIREEMEALGGQELFMPALQPKENWQTTGRWDSMDDLYKVRDASEREFALGPTHEEIVVPLVQKSVSSYRDFPFSAYQFQTKFRMELRAKSGILRGREFLMKDLYSFHLSQRDLDKFYEKAKQAYVNIFRRAGIGEQTHVTFASGGSFSKYSHEFQTVTEAGEDMIHICQKCLLAINREIKEEVSACPECGGTDFKEAKAVEVGNIFKLGTKYSKPFVFKVKTKAGKDKTVIMGCYGIGLGRLLGTIAEVCHDDKGLLWPEEVAPFKIHLLSLNQDKEAKKIYRKLTKRGHDVLFDEREVGAGEKFADSDLLGLPWRFVISEKSLASGGVEVKKRGQDQTRIVSASELVKFLKDNQ